MAALEGETLGRYNLVEVAGRGGMADVYRGFDTGFEREVAVKVFKRDDDELLRRFLREARLMASLKHPHLMPVYDTGESRIDGSNRYYIVMPFMDGGTLRARVRRGSVSFAETCRYMRGIADALDYIHSQGIIHRDIKASNVLLSTDGTCYLADFGIARTTSDATQLTSTGNVLGTVDYVAPELFEPEHRADATSDLYSLGVLLYELVTGRLPFMAENQIAVVAMHVNKQPPSPRLFVPTLSAQIEQVLLKALAKKPEQRYQSGKELADAFCRAASMQGKIVAQPDVQGVAGNARNAATRGQYERVERIVPAIGAEANAPTMMSPPQPPFVLSEGGVDANRTTPTARPAGQRKRRASPQRTRSRVVTIFALLALLAVIGPMLYVAIHDARFKGNGLLPGQTQTTGTGNRANAPTNGVTVTPNLTGTAQGFVNATQQAGNATATAVAGVTVTAQVQASATAGVIQTATSGNPTLQDPLTQQSSAQWDETGNCAFQTDGYHVKVGTTIFDNGKIQGCIESAYSYQNMAISVDMNILSGHSGGVFFRVGKKTFGAYSGYLFEVDSTKGQYKISSSGNFSTGTNNAILQDWTPSKAIHAGTNTLQIIARGGTLSFYINGTFLAPSYQDTSFTEGYIAFLASTERGGANADVVYSNLKVFAL